MTPQWLAYYKAQPPHIQEVLNWALPQRPVLHKYTHLGPNYAYVVQYGNHGTCTLAIINGVTDQPTGYFLTEIPFMALKPVTYH